MFLLNASIVYLELLLDVADGGDGSEGDLVGLMRDNPGPHPIWENDTQLINPCDASVIVYILLNLRRAKNKGLSLWQRKQGKNSKGLHFT